MKVKSPKGKTGTWSVHAWIESQEKKRQENKRKETKDPSLQNQACYRHHGLKSDLLGEERMFLPQLSIRFVKSKMALVASLLMLALDQISFGPGPGAT